MRQMKERAAKLWETDAADGDGGSAASSAPATSRITFTELAARLDETGGPVVGRGAVNPRGVGGSFSGYIVDVEVDPETGKVTILRFTSVQDVGKAIHPSYVEGQMQGGSVQGIGWALNEEYYMSAGRRDAELQLPRLPHADRARPADDRHRHRRSAESRPSVRRARRRRGEHRAAAGRHRQRHLPRGAACACTACR